MKKKIPLAFTWLGLQTVKEAYRHCLKTETLNVPNRPPSGDGGIVVSIAAFQAVDPGSIPGHRSVLHTVVSQGE